MHNAYSWSRFLYVQERMGLVAIFHALHPHMLFLSSGEWQKTLQGSVSAELHELLVQEKILVTDGTDDASLNKARIQAAKKLSRTTILYLMLAQGCNNACTYCPIPELAIKHGSNLLSFDDAVAGITLWQEHMREYRDGNPYYLILYGGEPLLNTAVLEQILQHVGKLRQTDALPAELEIVLPTNGAFIDRRLASLFKKHDVQVALGVDGPPELHNKTRVTVGGLPTSDIIPAAVGMLHEAGVRISASATLTPSSVLHASAIRDYLRKLGIGRFGFNILKGSALKQSLGDMPEEDYYRATAQAVVAGYGETPVEFQLQKKLEALRSGEPFGVDCTCYGNQIVVQADGAVTNCPFLRVELGQVKSLSGDFRIANTDAVNMWRARLPLFSTSGGTTDSPLLHGGGCAWGATEREGDTWKPDSGNATYNKEVIHALTWKLLPDRIRQALTSGELPYWHYRRDGNL